MTGQSLLDRMELLNQELQLQAGEADVARGLLALNVAQDYFESVAAQRAKVFGSGIGNTTATANTESTTFPAAVLRIDRIQFIDPATSKPAWDLQPLRRTGGHAVKSFWPMNLVASSMTGKPTGYWTNGSNIYWSPTPSATYTVRWYGFQAADDITAGGTFVYPDIVALPLASMAVRLVKGGLDDEVKEISSLALETFTQVLDTLGNFNRDGAPGMEYTEVHST